MRYGARGRIFNEKIKEWMKRVKTVIPAYSNYTDVFEKIRKISLLFLILYRIQPNP